MNAARGWAAWLSRYEPAYRLEALPDQLSETFQWWDGSVSRQLEMESEVEFLDLRANTAQ